MSYTIKLKFNPERSEAVECLKSGAKSHAVQKTVKLTNFCPERTSSRASSFTPSLMSSNRSVTIRGGAHCGTNVDQIRLFSKNVFLIGGMVVAFLKDYYYAAQLRAVSCWCDEAYIARWKDRNKRRGLSNSDTSRA